MEKYVIHGGQRLSGTVTAMRSKNSTLPILAAALLADSGQTAISNVPSLRDIETMLKVLRRLGAKVEWDKRARTVTIEALELSDFEAPYDLVSQMRASFLVLGSLIGRLHKAKVSLPGGCSLGQRPVNLHLKGFAHLGVEIKEEAGYILADGEVRGGEVYFDRPSHTGTENIMLGAAKSRGVTKIINAACDPEVVDLANCLNMMGANIAGAGSTVVIIRGVDKLSGIVYCPMADRLEVGSLLCMSAATGGTITVEDADPGHLEIVLLKLKEMGCSVNAGKNSLSVSAPGKLKATDFLTHPYPGFPTDLQACFMALATVAEGTSHIRETIFDDRFTHCMELMRLGARISISSDEAIVEGVERLSGATVMASDIRAGAGLVTACLAADGTSEVRRIYHIERGYDALNEKLKALGASIAKVEE